MLFVVKTVNHVVPVLQYAVCNIIAISRVREKHKQYHEQYSCSL